MEQQKRKSKTSWDIQHEIKDLVVPTSAVGIRHLQTLLMFLCLVAAYAMRVNLSVAIVAMVDRLGANPEFEEFPNWDDGTRSLILSSFFWGYVITQVPAGQLAQRYGPKMLLVFSVFMCSTFTMLTPLAASVGGWKAVCACRVVQGMSQGFIFPSMHTLLAKWAPPSERGRLSTYTYAGSQVGTVLALPISGFLASSSWGWPSIFYTMGGVGILWSIVWFFFGSDSPTRHPTISLVEKHYIEASLGNTEESEKRKLVTPWRCILTSLPMWSLIVVHSGHNWGFWTLLTEMPSYMNYVLHFNIKDNAMLSALPYFVMWVLSFFFSFLSDFVINKNWISLGVSRKTFNTIGHWIPGVALIGLAYVKEGQHSTAVALLTLAVGINSSTYVGFQLNHIDLAPNFAGTMMGITNCVANIMSFVAPLVVGLVITDSHSAEQWRVVFFISAGVYFCGNLFFMLFGSADLQPWNEPNATDDEESPKRIRKMSNDEFITNGDTNRAEGKL